MAPPSNSQQPAPSPKGARRRGIWSVWSSGSYAGAHKGRAATPTESADDGQARTEAHPGSSPAVPAAGGKHGAGGEAGPVRSHSRPAAGQAARRGQSVPHEGATGAAAKSGAPRSLEPAASGSSYRDMLEAHIKQMEADQRRSEENRRSRADSDSHSDAATPPVAAARRAHPPSPPRDATGSKYDDSWDMEEAQMSARKYPTSFQIDVEDSGAYVSGPEDLDAAQSRTPAGNDAAPARPTVRRLDLKGVSRGESDTAPVPAGLPAPSASSSSVPTTETDFSEDDATPPGQPRPPEQPSRDGARRTPGSAGSEAGGRAASGSSEKRRRPGARADPAGRSSRPPATGFAGRFQAKLATQESAGGESPARAPGVHSRGASGSFSSFSLQKALGPDAGRAAAQASASQRTSAAGGGSYAAAFAAHQVSVGSDATSPSAGLGLNSADEGRTDGGGAPAASQDKEKWVMSLKQWIDDPNEASRAPKALHASLSDAAAVAEAAAAAASPKKRSEGGGYAAAGGASPIPPSKIPRPGSAPGPRTYAHEPAAAAAPALPPVQEAPTPPPAAGADRGAGDAAVPAPEPSPEPVLPSKPRPRSAALSHLRASASARRGLVHGNSAGSAHQAAPHHSVSGALPTQTPEAQPRPLSPRKSQIEHETLLDAMSDMAIDELVREVKGLVRELSEAPPSAERTDDAAHGARKHRTRLVERLERGRGLLQEEKARREGDRKAPGPGAPSPSADAAPAEGADAAPAEGADAAPAEGAAALSIVPPARRSLGSVQPVGAGGDATRDPATLMSPGTSAAPSTEASTRHRENDSPSYSSVLEPRSPAVAGDATAEARSLRASSNRASLRELGRRMTRDRLSKLGGNTPTPGTTPAGTPGPSEPARAASQPTTPQLAHPTSPPAAKPAPAARPVPEAATPPLAKAIEQDPNLFDAAKEARRAARPQSARGGRGGARTAAGGPPRGRIINDKTDWSKVQSRTKTRLDDRYIPKKKAGGGGEGGEYVAPRPVWGAANRDYYTIPRKEGGHYNVLQGTGHAPKQQAKDEEKKVFYFEDLQEEPPVPRKRNSLKRGGSGRGFGQSSSGGRPRPASAAPAARPANAPPEAPYRVMLSHGRESREEGGHVVPVRATTSLRNMNAPAPSPGPADTFTPDGRPMRHSSLKAIEMEQQALAAAGISSPRSPEQEQALVSPQRSSLGARTDVSRGAATPYKRQGSAATSHGRTPRSPGPLGDLLDDVDDLLTNLHGDRRGA